MEHSDDPQKQSEVKPSQSIFFEQEIRASSSSSSNNQQSKSSRLQQLDSIIQPSSNIQHDNEYQHADQHKRESRVSQIQSQGLHQESREGANSIIVQVQKNWIIKQAQIQRIGGTYNFFAHFLQVYQRNMVSRKTILNNISFMVDKNKISKALPVMMLSQYFKDYSSLSKEFEQKSLDFQVPPRLQYKKKQVNIHAQLKEGFDLLVNLRRNTAHQVSRIEKYVINTTHKKINGVLDKYWGLTAGHQMKANHKKNQFEEKENKFRKRINKISKLYDKGQKGEKISQDYFEEMCKFIRQQRQLRYSIYNWGMELLSLRQNIIQQDYTLFNELQLILTQFKNLNITVYQLQKKKFNYLVELKQDIQKKYLFEVLCTPLDNDYIISVLNYKNKLSIKSLQQDQYEHFIKQEYFSEVVGDPMQLLKGTIVKSFPLKNEEEQLIKTISGNLIHYNKKSLEIKCKMKLVNVKGEFEGSGCVYLRQKIIGILYDSDRVHKVYFKDDNRAEQLLLFLSGQFDSELQ